MVSKETTKQETIENIKLEEVLGSSMCQYTVIENKLATLYKNQEQILKAIKLLNKETPKEELTPEEAIIKWCEETSKNQQEQHSIEEPKQETLEDKIKSLVDEWCDRQNHYFDVAYENVDNVHANRKFTYKAMATRDCWKELLTLLNSHKNEKHTHITNT
jgi:hypothetical protein